jgi:hypothetical protein
MLAILTLAASIGAAHAKEIAYSRHCTSDDYSRPGMICTKGMLGSWSHCESRDRSVLIVENAVAQKIEGAAAGGGCQMGRL